MKRDPLYVIQVRKSDGLHMFGGWDSVGKIQPSMEWLFPNVRQRKLADDLAEQARHIFGLNNVRVKAVYQPKTENMKR